MQLYTKLQLVSFYMRYVFTHVWFGFQVCLLGLSPTAPDRGGLGLD